MSDEILDIEEEETTGWIKQVESLSKEDKKEAIRELLEYRDSVNFIETLTYCKEKIAEINSEVYRVAYSREKCEATKSILDGYVATAKGVRDIANKVENERFKNYLVSSRIGALESAILFKIGDPYGVPFDLPIHSDLDIIKTLSSVYNSFAQFLKDCISHYDDKDVVVKMDEEAKEKKSKKPKKEVEEDNPNQPY